MLEPIEQAILVAIDNLTRGTYDSTDGESIAAELSKMGQEPPNSLILGRLINQLKDEGYLKDSTYITAGGAVFVELNSHGRQRARDNTEPFGQIMAENRRIIASDSFAAAFPQAFELWADAEELLFADDAEAQLTTVGHKIREASQAFATAMIERFGADHPPSEVSLVKKRLGAVISHNRQFLGTSQRELLERLGDLWEITVDLIQRQTHAAQKEGEAVTWHDGRRIVTLTMFLMIEFVAILEDQRIPPPATLEPG